MTAPDTLPPRTALLLVDDQPLNIQVLHQIFQAEHDLYMATDGQTALDTARRVQPDLILLDVMMPVMDGLTVCRTLQADPVTRDIPVIFVTGQNAPEEETAGFEAGAVDFISKPINPATVRARVRTHLTLKAQADQLRALALNDGLTGVANRRHFDDRLQRDWRNCRRRQVPLGLILIDVDHFKPYNDHHGHQAGDTALQRVAAALRDALRRPEDLLARYGGEEFVCLVPGADLEATRQTAEHLREAVAREHIPHDASPVGPQVSISLGVAASVPAADADDPAPLLKAADRHLYAAKQAGRNRVAVTAA